MIGKLQEAMAAHPAVLGCRLMGAGLGGCMIVLVRPGMVDQVDTFARKIFGQVAGITPSAFEVVPSAGYAVELRGSLVLSDRRGESARCDAQAVAVARKCSTCMACVAAEWRQREESSGE